MGWLREDEAILGLQGALNFFRKYIEKLAYLSECEIYMLITILCQYLYGKYYKLAKQKNGNRYFVDSNLIGEVYKERNVRFYDIVSNIILYRNRASHIGFTSMADDNIMSLYNDPNLRELLIYEGIIYESGKFVESVGGKYVPVSVTNDSSDISIGSQQVKSVFNAAALMGGDN